MREGREVRQRCYVCSKWTMCNNLSACIGRDNATSNENEISDNAIQEQLQSNETSVNN